MRRPGAGTRGARPRRRASGLQRLFVSAGGGRYTPWVSGETREIGPDKFREECGVFGIYGHPDAANLTYLGLYALQHRGQEAGGIAAWNGRRIGVEKGMGYVADLFDEARLARLPGALRRRARPLLHDGGLPPRERPADRLQHEQGPPRDRAQREPRERRRASRASWSRRGRSSRRPPTPRSSST